jgi:hypothetical protein
MVHDGHSFAPVYDAHTVRRLHNLQACIRRTGVAETPRKVSLTEGVLWKPRLTNVTLCRERKAAELEPNMIEINAETTRPPSSLNDIAQRREPG